MSISLEVVDCADVGLSLDEYLSASTGGTLAAGLVLAPTGTTSYNAVTVWPAPISPASTLSLLKSSLRNMRFS